LQSAQSNVVLKSLKLAKHKMHTDKIIFKINLFAC